MFDTSEPDVRRRVPAPCAMPNGYLPGTWGLEILRWQLQRGPSGGGVVQAHPRPRGDGAGWPGLVGYVGALFLGAGALGLTLRRIPAA
jgi:hypothetical protein